MEKHTSKTDETSRVTYRVKGFTCIACAVGLEVLLQRIQGVSRAEASYPENNVVIGFDDRVVSERALKGYISVWGFSVA